MANEFVDERSLEARLLPKAFFLQEVPKLNILKICSSHMQSEKSL